MKEVMLAIGSALAGALLAGALLLRGYSIRPRTLSLPFVNADLSRFAGLSPVQLFLEISAVALPVAAELPVEAVKAVEATPIVMIHTGWNIVCEAFVRRFGAYPEDEQINAAVAVIGGQNVEFLRMYRDINTAALRDVRNVGSAFAADYLVRAPSLAERIEGRPIPIQGISGSLLAMADALRMRG